MNREMDDTPPNLPDISQAVISPEDLKAYFRDLNALASIDSIVIRPIGGKLGVAEPSLHGAERGLLDNAIAAAQIRYRHDQSSWFDTIKRLDDGFALVRMRSTELSGP